MALVRWNEKWIVKGSATQDRKKRGSATRERAQYYPLQIFAYQWKKTRKLCRQTLRKSGLDVSFAEFVTLEEEGLPRGFGQGVRKAVAEVEAGGMAAFAVV